MTRRTPQSAAALFGFRDSSAEIFRCGSRSYRARDLIRDASELADRITPFARQRVIVPSDEPFAAVCGVVGCWMADATLVLWRRSAIAVDALASLTSASAIAEREAAGGRWRVEPAGSSQPTIEAPGDVVIMTSGSTGQPKGVALDLCRALNNAALAGSRLDIDETSFWTVDADMSLISPFGHTLMAWCYQKPACHLTGMDWKERSALFARAPGGFGGTPLQLREFAQRLDGEGPRVLVSSGDFLMPSLGQSVADRFPDSRLHKVYGLTEVSGRLCVLRHEQRQIDPEPAGYPLPGFAVTIAHADADDEVGEVCASGPTMMLGYWRAGRGFEPQNAEPFRTGDLGRMADDGLITLQGRLDDVFKVGAEKVDRHSIEKALQPLLKGCEFCVLPVLHPAFGQTPALFVAANDRTALPPRGALIQAIRRELPSRFVPSLMLWSGAGLPRLLNGKVDHQRLIGNCRTLPDLYDV